MKLVVIPFAGFMFLPTWKSVIRVLVWMNVYMVAIGVINWLTSSNYLFFAHKPETANLINLLGPGLGISFHLK